jgi:hypothetical protein
LCIRDMNKIWPLIRAAAAFGGGPNQRPNSKIDADPRTRAAIRW